MFNLILSEIIVLSVMRFIKIFNEQVDCFWFFVLFVMISLLIFTPDHTVRIERNNILINAKLNNKTIISNHLTSGTIQSFVSLFWSFFAGILFLIFVIQGSYFEFFIISILLPFNVYLFDKLHNKISFIYVKRWGAVQRESLINYGNAFVGGVSLLYFNVHVFDSNGFDVKQSATEIAVNLNPGCKIVGVATRVGQYFNVNMLDIYHSLDKINDYNFAIVVIIKMFVLSILISFVPTLAFSKIVVAVKEFISSVLYQFKARSTH